MNVNPSFFRTSGLLLTLLAIAAPLQAKIGALGRIIPQGDILHLAAPGDVVTVIHVKEGDRVAANAPLLTFRGRADAERDLAFAEMELREVEELGALSIKALELRNQVMKRDVDFGALRLGRFTELGGEVASGPQLEQRNHQMKNAEIAYQAAVTELERAKLEREFRLRRARSQVEGARARLERTILRAPKAMTVLRVNAMVGAPAGGGAVQLANLDEMHVLAEVFAGDLPKLKVGQAATVTGSALPGAIAGRVLSIGRVISGRAKVVEVLIRLDEPAEAAKLLNLEVNVSVDD